MTTVRLLFYGLTAAGAVVVRWLVVRYRGGRGYEARVVEFREGEPLT